MITPVQLKKLQAYASEKDPNIRLVNEEDTKRIRIYYGDEPYICLANKVSSMLTMKMVTAQIDKCVKSKANKDV